MILVGILTESSYNTVSLLLELATGYLSVGDMSVSTLNFSKKCFFFFTNCKTNIHFCNRLLTSLPRCNFNFFDDSELTFFIFN